MFHDELAQLIDDRQRVGIALSLGCSPGKETMTTQNNSVTALAGADRLAQHHGQFESRPLPGQPDQSVFKLAIELLHFFATIRRRGYGNSPVGMKMIDMG